LKKLVKLTNKEERKKERNKQTMKKERKKHIEGIE